VRPVETGGMRSRRASPLLAALLWSCVAPAPVRPPPLPPPAPAASLPDAASAPADRTIAVNVATAPGLSMTAAALAAGGLAAELTNPGLMTLLAPSDAAWRRLAPGAADALLRPENRVLLDRVLRQHLLRGRVTSDELRARVRDGGGRAELSAVGGTLVVTLAPGGALRLTDGQGSAAYLEVTDLPQANGMLHVVNGVLVPPDR